MTEKMTTTMKNWNRKTIAIVLAVVMVVSVFAGTGVVWFVKADERSIEVGEFYHELIKALNYDTAEFEYPDDYFEDLTPSDEYYSDMMIATSYGMVFTDSSQVANVNSLITRDRAALVANYCLGFQVDNNKEAFSDYSLTQYPNDAQVAIERGWFELVNGNFEPQKPITEKELKRIIADIIEVTAEPSEFDNNSNNQYTIADDVIIVPDNIGVEWDALTDSFILSNDVPDLAQGKSMAIIIQDVPQVFKVSSINYLDDGRVYVETSENITEEKIDNLVIAGTNAIDPHQLIPAEGVTVGQSASSANGPRKVKGSGSIPLNLDSKSVPLLQSEGVKCTLSMIPNEWKVNYSLESTSSRQYAYAVIEGDLQIKFDLSANWVDAHFYENEIEIARYPVWGFGFVGIYAVLDFKGDLTTQYTAHLQAGFEYKDESASSPEFRLIHSCQKKSWSLDANAEAGIGLKIAAGVDAFGYRGDLFATLGAQVYAKAHLGDDSSVGSCISFASWMSLDIGAELVKKHVKATESDKVLNKKAINVFDVTNSPIRLNYHMEDGVQVAKCTRGYTTSISVEEIKNSLTNPINDEIKDKEFNIEPENTYIKTLSSSDLEFSINNGKATLEKLKNAELNYHDISLPSAIEGYPVTSIAERAFEGSNVATVIIPNSISTISNKAFFNCRLTRIAIMGKDVTIGKDAFSYQLEDGLTQADMTCELYCFDNSTAKKFADSNKGFEYHSLAWDGKTVWPVEEDNNIYHVHTGFELAYIRDYVNYGHPMTEKKIEIENDIDLNGQSWTPIGISADIPFSGSFDGNSYSIDSLSASPSPKMQSAGLFGYVSLDDGVFENLNLKGVSSGYNAGSLIGALNINDGKVTIRNIVSHVDVSSSGNGGTAGGIIGNAVLSASSTLNLWRCASSGIINGRGGGGYSGTNVGGVIGHCENGDVDLEECAVQGTIKGLAYGPSTGGFVGSVKTHSFRCSNGECFAYIDSRSTNGDASVGGIVGGWNQTYFDDSTEWVFENTYTSSVLDGAYAKGAFVTVSESQGTSIKSVVVKNCYFDITKNPDIPEDRLKAWCAGWQGRHSLLDNVIDSKGYSISELINNRNLYTNWDTEKVWEFASSGMPKLKWIDYLPCAEHHFSNSVIAPTCTAKGYTTYTCDICQYHYNSDYVDANGHSYEYTRTIAPTCTAQGYDLYTCSVCGATTKKNTVKAFGHDYETVQVVAPNCTERGYTEKKCKTCGTVTKMDYVDASGHDYSVSHTEAATCTEKGLDTYICNNCGDTYTKEVAALGHNFTWVSNTHIAPNCTEAGYTLQTCSRCGETQKTNELLATGHDYGDVYGQAYLEQVYASDHRFIDSLSYTPNTVTENTIGSTAIGSNELLRAGWMTLPREIRLNVDNLSAVEDYHIARQRHLLGFSAQVDIPAVFAYDTSTGRAPEYSAIPYTDSKGTLYELDGTGLVAFLSKTEAEEKGVLNGDGTVNVPKALAQGLNIAYSAGLPGTYICLPELEFTSGFSGWNTPVQVFHYDGVGVAKAGVYTVNFCFYNEEQSGTAGTTIKVYDHAALNYTTPAKDGTPAQVYHKCIDCGEVLTEDLGFDDALKVKSASLSLGNNLIMNFKVSKEVLEGYEEPFLEVTRNGKATTLREYTEQGDNYVFSFTNIAPQTMNDEMTAVLYASKDGKVYASSEVKTSAKTYLYNILKAYSGDQHVKLRTLLVDLLNYGAKAQQYTNYKTSSLVSDDLTAEQKAWGSTGELKLNNITNVAYKTVENPVVTWKSASLILDNAVTVRYKFTADSIDGLSVKVQYGNVEKEFDNSAFESLGDGAYSLKFSGLSAHQLKEPLYATVYKDGTAVSNTLSYSVESYASQVKESQPDSSLDELTTALMYYGTSAIDYKNG